MAGIIPTELARKNRFVVNFPDQFDIPSYLIQKVNKPVLLNGVWQNIVIDFIEVVGESVSPKLQRMASYCNTHRTTPLFHLHIVGLNNTGDSVEYWRIPVEELVCINYGNYDYGDDDIQTVTLTLKPFTCILNNTVMAEWENYFNRTVIVEKFYSK